MVCGGAYNSPQVLMLSGIGPADLLTGYQIEVLLDQPQVGANLQDHANVTLAWESDEPVSLLNATTPEALAEFESAQTGPLTSNAAESGGFIRTRAELEAPDVQFHLFAGLAHESEVDLIGHGVLITACVLKPYGSGSVAIASADPTGKPVIRHNYWSDERDLQTAVAGTRAHSTSRRRPACGRTPTGRSTVPKVTTKHRCAATSRRTRRPSSTPTAPARSAPSWTTTCASWASKACASATPA